METSFSDDYALEQRRRERRSSSQSYFDPMPYPDHDRPRRRLSTSHPSLERQDSVEYLDTVSYQGDQEAMTSSSPSLNDAQQGTKKEKKKRHFHVFHRRHHMQKERRSELDKHLADSLPAGTHIKPPSQDRLSLENTWSHSNWRPLEQQYKRNASLRSSNTSLLSAESEGREVPSDEEMIESLMNPTGRDSSRASVSPPREEQSSTLWSTSMDGGVEYSVDVTLMSGHNLAIRDRTGTSDPYVKFKCLPFKYRSSIIQRNLNPEWNEHFSFRTTSVKKFMRVKVYDHDYGSLDDYMGGQTVDLATYADGELHIVELGLEDPSAKNESLGYLRLGLKISSVIVGDQEGSGSFDQPSKNSKKRKSGASNVWTNILTVTLLEGHNLPAMDQNGLSDPYCKFKLGSQKHKSKTEFKTLDPKWMQRFDMRMFDDCSTLHIEVWDKDFPQNDDFIGLCSVDLTSLPRDVTLDFKKPLLDREEEEVEEGAYIHFNLAITASRVDPEEEGDETSSLHQEIRNSYSLLRSLNIKAIKERNIGFLSLKIDKVVDLVPCNCFVLVELGNSIVKTHTVGKSASPQWDKTFDFTVGDIHDELELMVYKQTSRNDQLLGKVKIPLHRLRQGCQQFALKDKHALNRTRGILYIESELVFNPVRAMIRTVNPKENKLIEAEQKFKRKVLLDNIKRVTNLVRTVQASVAFIASTWSWENKYLSAASLLVFMLMTVFGELWMGVMVGALVFLYQLMAVQIKGNHVWQTRVSSNIYTISNVTSRTVSIDNDDSDFSDSVEEKHSSLREKLKLFQEILVLVQNVLGEVADMEEGIRNLLNWKVPFLSLMAMLVFLGGAVLLYFVPLRYVILVWGINKYTKILRKGPNYISNNELLDFLSRCPSNQTLKQWQEIPLLVHQKSLETTSNRRKSDKKNK